jgi:predicted ribosomally synthesized peptide with SipW-like signal peptide
VNLESFAGDTAGQILPTRRDIDQGDLVKKLVIASAAMGGAALIAFGASGTFAAFSDTASVANTAGAGSIVLNADSPNATVPAQALALKPGGTAQYAYFVQNSGSLPGNISARLAISDQENSCVGPEDGPTGVDKTCGADQGEFSIFAQVQPFITTAAKAADCNIANTGRQPLSGPIGLQDAANLAKLLDQAVPAGQGGCVVLDVTLPENPNINMVQSDSATVTATFTLAQQ